MMRKNQQDNSYFNLFLKKKQWISLIKIIVAIILLIVLALALLPSIETMQTRARDTTRHVDMNTIANAIELYASNNQGTYPIAPFWWDIAHNDYTQSTLPKNNNLSSENTNSTKSWRVIDIAPALKDYLSDIPTDPRQGLTSDISGECATDTSDKKYFSYYTDRIWSRYAITSIKEWKKWNTNNCRWYVNERPNAEYQVVGDGLIYSNDNTIDISPRPPLPPEIGSNFRGNY